MAAHTWLVAPLSTAAHWSFIINLVIFALIMMVVWRRSMPALARQVTMGLLVATFGFFGWMYWQANHAQLTLTADTLQLNLPLYSRTIHLGDLQLEKARVIDMQTNADVSLSWRTNGVGLPGYQLGWFALKPEGKALVAITDKWQVLLLPTTLGFSLLLSMPQAQAVLQQLNAAQD